MFITKIARVIKSPDIIYGSHVLDLLRFSHLVSIFQQQAPSLMPSQHYKQAFTVLV